jgi:hypothetical protein
MFVISEGQSFHFLVHTREEAEALGLNWNDSEPLINGVSKIPEYIELDDRSNSITSRAEADSWLEELKALIGATHPELIRAQAYFASLY